MRRLTIILLLLTAVASVGCKGLQHFACERVYGPRRCLWTFIDEPEPEAKQTSDDAEAEERAQEDPDSE